MINQKPQTVLIVGAGPTGLVLALYLRKLGISVRIIDKSTKPGSASRAIAVQARTLEFYRQIGIADEVIAGGILAKDFVLRRKGKTVATAHLGAIGEGISPYAYLLFYPQDLHEKLLIKHLNTLGVLVEREKELIHFIETESGVEAKIKTPQGEEIINASYICGCDGAHSQVRHVLDIKFPGGTYSQVFFVADVQATGEMAKRGVQISVSRKDFCIVLPVRSEGSVRLIGIVPPEKELFQTISFQDVEAEVKENTKLNTSKVNWFSSYHVHHRVADHFQKGRAFLLGDAGHIHSPAGGQGMNTGIGDSVNLAWKLAAVIKKEASPTLLETYQTERITFARTLVATTDKAFQAIASRSFLGSFFRAYFLPNCFAFITRFKFVLRLLFRLISQVRIRYPHSAISVGKAGKIHAGDRLPWVQYGKSDNFESLKSLAWQVHVYGVLDKSFEKEVSLLKLPVLEFNWNDEAKQKGLMKNAFYLIRPDGHVGLAHPQQVISVLKKYLSYIQIP